MSKFIKGHLSPASQQECYALVQKHSVNALRYQRNAIENNYQREISLLAKQCARLINQFGESPQSIILCMENAMNASYGLELKEIDDEIQLLFKRRRNLPVNNTYCEREIANLTFQINALEKRKLISITETIQEIIFDALDCASRNDGAEIPPGFNLQEYHKPMPGLFL